MPDSQRNRISARSGGEGLIRASPSDRLALRDPDCLRREYIAACFKHDAAGLAALDALGGAEFSPPPINIDIIQFLHGRISRDPVNQLAGMTLSGPVRKAAERDRTVIWWLLHDAYMRAKVVPDRIKAEQRQRANAARKAGELALIGWSSSLVGFFEQAHAVADVTEPIVGRKDPLRPPLSTSDVERLQNWAKQFVPEAPATWGPFLGVAFQPGDVVTETSRVGRDAALGALAVIIPGLVKKRGCDPLIAQLATVVFDARPVITRKEVAYRRSVFLAQRGLLLPTTA
jgi:hypothetical protein